MWRKTSISAIVCVVLACPTFLHGVSGAEGGGTNLDPSEFTKKLAGRSVTVRVYPSNSAADDSFTLIDIPLTNAAIDAAAVKTAYPSVSWSSVLAVCAPDQADPVVAESLGRSVWVDWYSERLSLSLLDLAMARETIGPSWTVADARGEPIPGAAVMVYADLGGFSDQGTKMLIGEDTTDDLGQLPRWASHGDASFVLKVQHPNYGTAIVEYYSHLDNGAGTWWAALVPRDSEAVARGVQGTIIDENGRPVAGAAVECIDLWQPGTLGMIFHGGGISQALTDAEGEFSLCVPRFTRDYQWDGLPEEGTYYTLKISPPAGSNLGEVFPYGQVGLYTGSRGTFILPPKNLPKSYHSFSFEYAEGAVPTSFPVGEITLVFFRNGFEWLRVGYDQGQYSPSLVPGTLRALIKRWPGEEFQFQDIELTESSPTHLTFKPMPAIRYRGRVVDAAAGTPIPDAFVAVGPVSERWEGPSLIDELSRQHQTQAAGEPTDQGPPLVYKTHDRVTRTDAAGAYEFTFMPGVAPSLEEFTAVVPGRLRVSISASALVPDEEGIVELPPIEVPPAGEVDGFTDLVFEDENGPVSDPDRLKDIMIEVRAPDGRTYAGRHADFQKSHGVVAGTYRAEAIWNETYYTFGPIDVVEGQVSTATFRPASIMPADVTCTGQVVDGFTGEPISGAVVVYNRVPGGGDLSSLTAKQWSAIDALDTAPDVTNPALTPLLTRLLPSTVPVAEGIPQVARTDAEGWFSVRWRQSPFTRRTDCLQAFAKDFLGAQQQITFLSRPMGSPDARPELRRIEPDANGVAAIPSMKLFPAATVLIEPIVPDVGEDEAKPRIDATWVMQNVIATDWIDALEVLPADNDGASTYSPPSIPANVQQSIYVPAVIGVYLSLCMQAPDPLPPIRKALTLDQGQVRDLGALEFLPGIEVTARLVDSADNPVAGVCIRYTDENWLSARAATDAAGIIRVRVPAYSGGTFDIHYKYERTSGSALFFYTIGGREDMGVEFVLELSDEALACILQGDTCSSAITGPIISR